MSDKSGCLSYMENKEPQCTVMTVMSLSHMTLSGSACLAQFSKDMEWYRGEVLNSEDDSKIEVLFVDYGNIETVHISKIRGITPELMELPRQVFPCKLHGVSPIGESKMLGSLEVVALMDNVRCRCKTL